MKHGVLTRALSILLCLALLMGIAFTVSAEDGEADAYTYDFDDGMQGWTTLDADGDGHNWTPVSQFGSVYGYYYDIDLSSWVYGGEGDALVSGSYVNDVGELSPDNYLISPKVPLGGSITLNAYNCDSYHEQIGIFVSTTGTAAADFTEVESWYMTGYHEWEEHTVDLSGFTGEGYVAIRNYGTYDEYLVSVDNVTITPPPIVHEHFFVYYAEGDTITAICSVEGCDLEENPTLQIVAPEMQTYGDGQSPLATLSGLDEFNEITGLDLSADDIRYFDVSNRAETELEGAPTDAGQYEARISAGEDEGEVTAFVEYEIVKAEPELTPPGALTLTYNGEDQELVSAGESEDGTFEYALGGKDETPDEEDFGAELPTGRDAGIYYVYYRFIPDRNHENAELAEPIEVTIAPAVLNVIADDQEKVQGDPDPELTYTAETLFGSDTLTGELAREEGEEPGEYAITVGTLDAGSNYVIEFTGATLYINAPIPDTGDGFNAALYVLGMASALAAAFVLRRRIEF